MVRTTTAQASSHNSHPNSHASAKASPPQGPKSISHSPGSTSPEASLPAAPTFPSLLRYPIFRRYVGSVDKVGVPFNDDYGVHTPTHALSTLHPTTSSPHCTYT